jgi:hypothetical protein
MIKNMTPEQHRMWEKLAGYKLTRTGQPRQRPRTPQQSLKLGLITQQEHDVDLFWQRAQDPTVWRSK